MIPRRVPDCARPVWQENALCGEISARKRSVTRVVSAKDKAQLQVAYRQSRCENSGFQASFSADSAVLAVYAQSFTFSSRYVLETGQKKLAAP